MAICAGALGLVGAPASALTVSVGGTTPVVGPISLPLPTTSVSVGAGGPVTVGVQTPLVDVSIGSPDLPDPTAPVSVIAPVSSSTPDATSTKRAPTASLTPAAPASLAPAAHLATAAPVTRLAEREISSMRHRTGNHAPNVTASIASSPGSGVLSSLPAIGARLMLWILLAGVVVAMRLFVGSATSRAPRAS